MLTTNEKNELIGKLNELNKNIKEVKMRLNQLADQKKSLINKRKATGKQVAEGINLIKKVKNDRDSLTTFVKEGKKKRDILNKAIANAISKVKGAAIKKKSTESQESPSMLMKQKEKLEFTLETEAISFEKEKKMMKVINELKKKLTAFKDRKSQLLELSGSNKEIKALRDKADTLHKEIQQKAKESQEKHELMINTSKSIDKFKKEEKKLNKEVDIKKEELDKVNSELSEKLKLLTELNQKIGSERKEKENKKQSKLKKTLADKRQEVEDKMARGEKLTNEDILIMQGSE